MRTRRLRLALSLAAFSLLAAACGSDSSPDEVVLLTHDSFFIPEEVLAEFTAEFGVPVRVLPPA